MIPAKDSLPSLAQDYKTNLLSSLQTLIPLSIVYLVTMIFLVRRHREVSPVLVIIQSITAVRRPRPGRFAFPITRIPLRRWRERLLRDDSNHNAKQRGLGHVQANGHRVV